MKARALAVLLVLGACGAQVKVAPVKIEPIHITVDVNIHEGAGSAAR